MGSEKKENIKFSITLLVAIISIIGNILQGVVQYYSSLDLERLKFEANIVSHALELNAQESQDQLDRIDRLGLCRILTIKNLKTENSLKILNAENNKSRTDFLLTRRTIKDANIGNFKDLSVEKINSYARSLIYAASIGDLNTIKEYLDNGIDINSRGKNDMTPLMVAVSSNQFDVVKFLLEYTDKSGNKPIDINAKDKWGTTSLAIAEIKNYDRIRELLLSAGASN